MAAAHRLGIAVRPRVGPSSILLGLMASGLDGQRFAFHGYAPVDAGERAKQLRAWEQHSARHDQTQLLIETPYRNAAMYATLLASLKGDTRLRGAVLTTSDEWVATHTIAEWKKLPAPQLDKLPTLFLFPGPLTMLRLSHPGRRGGPGGLRHARPRRPGPGHLGKRRQPEQPRARHRDPLHHRRRRALHAVAIQGQGGQRTTC